MHAERIDRLSKLLAAAETRRGAARLLVALPLGLTLVGRLGDGPDATAKDDDHGSSHRHHRRKARNRHDPGRDKEPGGGKKAKASALKPISFSIDNTGGKIWLDVEVTSMPNNIYCGDPRRAHVPHGTSVRFDMANEKAFARFSVNDTEYFFTFDNAMFQRPDVSVAMNGSTRNIRTSASFCPNRHGIQYLDEQGMDEGLTIAVTVNGHDFRVRRLRDTNYKNFTVVIPGTL